MSISVKRQELWCTVRDMRLSKCSIIIINCIKRSTARFESCHLDERYHVIDISDSNSNKIFNTTTNCDFLLLTDNTNVASIKATNHVLLELSNTVTST